MKQKQCKAEGCEVMFTPHNSFHKCHDWRCAIDFTKQEKERRAARDRRKGIKDFKASHIPTLLKKAQQAFNKYIRLRDKDEPCISCGYDPAIEKENLEILIDGEGKPYEVWSHRQWHAGHFKPVGGNGHIRFDENNCHKQCSICNNHKSGNLSEYEPNLIKKIGQDEVDRLKVKGVRVYDVDELNEIIDTYKQKIKEML